MVIKGGLSLEKQLVINNLDLARFYIEKLQDNIKKSHDILFNNNFLVEERYQMCVSFLVMSETTYLHLKDHQYKNEIFGSDIEQIDRLYEEYVFELKQAIKEKEDNLTWLQSRYDSFNESTDAALDAITSTIRSNQ